MACKSGQPTRLLHFSRIVFFNRLYVSWYSADLCSIASKRLILTSGWDTLCFPTYTHSMGTLCVPVNDAAVKYALPLNLGLRKSGAFRFRWDRRNGVGMSFVVAVVVSSGSRVAGDVIGPDSERVHCGP